jgi:hypothetical protein
MTAVPSKLSGQLAQSIEAMTKYYEKMRKSIEPFKTEELVMVNGKNTHTKHQCKKLEDKMNGPSEVIDAGENERYCRVKLPDSWKIHPTFNITLLERYQGTNPMKHVVEIEADAAGWKME